MTHLGAREYDPGIGRFISVDPIMDLADPQQINGYTYANNAPATLSDPTGLRPDGICGGNSSTCVPSNSVSKTTVTYNESWTKKKSGWYWKKYDENKAGKRYYTRGCLGCKNWIDRTRVIPWTEVVEAVGIFVPVLGPAADAVLGINDLIQGNYQAASERAASAIPLVGEARLAKNLLKKTRCEPNSFVPGTKVLMADGSTKPIEEVEIGDKVLATDPKSGKRKIETVTAEIKGEGTKRLVEVTIDIDGDQGSSTASITATYNHPFWVPEIGEWIDATDLESGQWLKTSAGTRVQVSAIKRWTAQLSTVHNLTVSDLHTYYVLAGATPILVHNCNPLDGIADELAGSKVTTGQVVDDAGNKVGAPVSSGENGSFSQVRDALKKSGVPHDAAGGFAATSHVETKIALAMRSNGVQRATVVINNSDGVCSGPYSCMTGVSAILPRGSSLTSVWRTEEGWHGVTMLGGG
ncbi:DddA-like double-stranded DNA deaminase toxin [Streptomyces sp. NPDC058378]|uniref:DddA-like double-stranded DNA deaminase toxin n=1 Tax=Streptomyces sp. NPDC058378 TaxID=3346469 RepID=UPI0036601255